MISSPMEVEQAYALYMGRKIQRIQTVQPAIVSIDGTDLATKCTFRDLHDFGARISVTDPKSVPDEFLLISRSVNMCARSRVVWRQGNELGIFFLRRAPYADETPMRQYLRQQFGKVDDDQQKHTANATNTTICGQNTIKNVAVQVPQKCTSDMQLLDLDPNSPLTTSKLDHAYRMKALKLHPDRGGDVAAFQSMSLAYHKLKMTCKAAGA